MRKSYPHTTLSDKKFCIKCGKPLKKRVAEEKPTVLYCYKCYRK